MTITRRNETEFEVVTDTVLSDGSRKSDSNCQLNGNILKSYEQRGCIRTGGLLRVILGVKSFARVQSLAIGESVEF